jgi:hypothetical protein
VALNTTQHRWLGSSSSPRAPLPSTPLERWCTGRGKIPQKGGCARDGGDFGTYSLRG